MREDSSFAGLWPWLSMLRTTPPTTSVKLMLDCCSVLPATMGLPGGMLCRGPAGNGRETRIHVKLSLLENKYIYYILYT